MENLSLLDFTSLDTGGERFLFGSVVIILCALMGLLLGAVVLRLARKWAEWDRDNGVAAVLASPKWRKPTLAVTPALVLLAVLPIARLAEPYHGYARQALALWVIAGMVAMCIRGVRATSEYFMGQLDLTASDNLRARTIATQLKIFERVLIVGLVIMGAAMALMLFDRIQQFGVSILASAGIIGITLGFAAQRTIANLFAGIQLAITQPIRIDDVVIVENEWGRIEEITLTYVVVRIWDLRRLVLPVSYFIERPFQNWTRTSADILGTVFLYMDYSVPVDAIRMKLQEIVKDAPEWDGKVCGVQVTNTTDKSVEVRALVSAADASRAWDLRCKVREGLLTFLQATYPQALPRVRLEMERLSTGHGDDCST